MELTVTSNKHIRPETEKAIPLKKENDLNEQKKKLAEASKGLESFFLYYVLKAMRKTVPDNTGSAQMGLGGGIGKDIYTQIFDQELSRKMAGKGDRSIASMLYRSLERVLDKQNGISAGPENVKESLPKAKYIKIQEKQNEPIKLEKEEHPAKKENAIGSDSTPGVSSVVDQKTMTGDSEAGIAVKNSVTVEVPAPSATVANSKVNHTIKPIASSYKDIIQNASEKYGLHPSLLESIINVESNGNPKAVSPAGAKGLMQLADTTASDMGVKNVFDPEENIQAGAKYLRQLINRFKDIKKALAAYNAGPEKVARYEGIPPYRETRNYVRAVIDSLPEGTQYYE